MPSNVLMIVAYGNGIGHEIMETSLRKTETVGTYNVTVGYMPSQGQ